MSEIAQEITTENKGCKGKCGASFAAVVYRASTLQNPIALAVLVGVIILDLMFFLFLKSSLCFILSFYSLFFSGILLLFFFSSVASRTEWRTIPYLSFIVIEIVWVIALFKMMKFLDTTSEEFAAPFHFRFFISLVLHHAAKRLPSRSTCVR
jgi:hypothetical protein